MRGRGATFFASDAVAALLGASLAATLGIHFPIPSVLTWSAVAIICVAVAGLLVLPTA